MFIYSISIERKNFGEFKILIGNEFWREKDTGSENSTKALSGTLVSFA